MYASRSPRSNRHAPPGSSQITGMMPRRTNSRNFQGEIARYDAAALDLSRRQTVSFFLLQSMKLALTGSPPTQHPYLVPLCSPEQFLTDRFVTAATLFCSSGL